MTFRNGMMAWTGGGSGATWGSITGTLSAQIDLDTALNGKQPLATVLTNTTAAFTTAQETKLAGIATGATANQTDAYLLNRANHTGTQAAGTITGLATVATSGSAADLTGNLAVARLNGGTGASASTFWRGDGTWATPGGGSDPWTYIKLASDYPTTLATWATVTGMSFTPAANTDYEVEWCLLCQTATATVGARPGIAWGTGYQYGGITLYTPSSATAQTIVNGSINTSAGTAQAAVGGLPIINRSYAHYGGATFRSGATPTAFELQLASETAGTAVTAKAGSWLKYRSIP